MLTIPGRIPIQIHPLFWLLAAFIGWLSTYTLTGTILAVVVILYSVLIHEYGHALTALAFKQSVRIQLAAFGGFTYRQGPKLKLWEEFLVVFDGPLAGFLLGCVGYVLWKYVPIENAAIQFIFRFTALVNFFWTVINLIPVLPLDGGHLLSIVLEGIFGFRGIKIAIVAGLVIAVGISATFFVLGQFLVGALFLILAFEGFRSLRYYRLLTDKDRDSDLQEVMKSAEAAFQEERYDEALEKFDQVRAKTEKGILYTMATQEMAEILHTQGKYAEAFDLLKPLKKHLSGETLPLYHFLAYTTRDYQAVTEVGDKCYQQNPSYDTALINALAYAALSKPEPALGWLSCAKREGHPTLHEELQKKEFDPIRSDPAFRTFVESL